MAIIYVESNGWNKEIDPYTRVKMNDGSIIEYCTDSTKVVKSNSKGAEDQSNLGNLYHQLHTEG